MIFDSTVPIGAGEAIYMSATARADEQAAALETFNRRSVGQGGAEWALHDVQPPAELRLYAARSTAHWVLGEGDRRLAVSW